MDESGDFLQHQPEYSLIHIPNSNPNPNPIENNTLLLYIVTEKRREKKRAKHVHDSNN